MPRRKPKRVVRHEKIVWGEETCPDCLDRNAIGPVGLAKLTKGGALRGATRHVPRGTMAQVTPFQNLVKLEERGCATCGGTARVRVRVQQHGEPRP